MEVDRTRKYRLAIDGHVLLQSEKTGVGQTAQYLIDELVKNRNFDIQINFVDFLMYRCWKIIKRYKKQGCRIKICWWMTYSLYAKLFERFKIPYFFLFGRRNDATLFFEYQVPFGVGTKVADYVYDVNYKVFPETVDELALKWLDEKLPLYCERSDVIITISEFSKKEIEKYLGIDSNKIHVVPCGVDCKKYNGRIRAEQIDAIRRKYGIENDYILYMGTLEPRKNIALLIEAYHFLTEQKDDLPTLVIAGKRGWMYEQLFQMVLDFGLKDQIVFTGYIEDADSAALMSGAMLFVFPSLYEGFGIPPLEAMACGTPVIVSDAEALLETVGEAARSFRCGDSVDLSSRISQLLEEKEERRRLSSFGQEWAEKHTWEKAGEKLEAVLVGSFKEVVGNEE